MSREAKGDQRLLGQGPDTMNIIRTKNVLPNDGDVPSEVVVVW